MPARAQKKTCENLFSIETYAPQVVHEIISTATTKYFRNHNFAHVALLPSYFRIPSFITLENGVLYAKSSWP